MPIGLSLPLIGRHISPEETGVPDYVSALSKGMDLGYKPANQSQDLLGKMLEAKLNSVKAKYQEPLMQAQIAHQKALADRARRGPAPVLSNLEKAIAGTQRIKEQYGEGSAEHKAAQDYVHRLASGAGGADKIPTNKVGQLLWLQNHPENLPDIPNEESYLPSINQSEQAPYQPNKKPDLHKMLFDALTTQNKQGAYQGPAREAHDLERLRQEVGEDNPIYKTAVELSGLKRSTAESMNKQRERRSTGLPPGQDYIKDQKGNNIAISRPFSEREKKEQSGRNFFNVVYPDILKATSYYSGEGSILRFNHDIEHYNTDKSAKKRIINYLAAIQLSPSTMVKENATVGGANTNQVYNRLMKSLVASDLPIDVERLETQFRLPRGAKLSAGLKFQEILNRATKAGENIPSRTTEYLSGDHVGHLYNAKTGKLEKHLVSPEEWDAFREAGGY